MPVLGIDTTARWCSVALVDAAKVLAKDVRDIGRGHAEILAGQVDKLLRLQNLKAGDLDRIVVCSGPGSFTGVRVGLSFAKGLALPFDIPVLGISALEVWAAETDPAGEKKVLSLADVRRGEVLWQIFENGQGQALPKLSRPDDVNMQFDIMVGSGTALRGGQKDKVSGFVDPAILAWLGERADIDKYPAKPLYHRPPDAKLPGGKILEA